MPQPETVPREELAEAESKSLAAAYLRDFDSVADLYAGDYRAVETLVARANALLAEGFPLLERERLSRKLISYMRSLRAPKPALAAAARLAQPDALAIVTGQQPGLAGGPALTLYKAAHVVALARSLRAAGVNAVPVFWAASEDHDIDEVNRFVAFDGDGRLVTLREPGFAPGGIAPLEELKTPAPDAPLIRKIAALLGADPAGARRAAPGRAEKTHAIKPADPAYAREALVLLNAGAGVNFGRALNAMLLAIFGGEGLVVLEPRLLRDLKGFRDAVGRELRKSREHRDSVEAGLRDVTAHGFAPPLELGPHTNVFMIERGKRRHVTRIGTGFSVDGRAAPSTREELLAELARRPQRFSVNVMLRPVVQAACLPVLAYAGGPAEIAYHGALRRLFACYGLAMPVLVPRWSFALAGNGDDVAGVREGVQQWGERARQAGAAIAEADNEMRGLLASLRTDLGLLRGVLGPDIERMEGRVAKTLGEVRGELTAHPLAGAPRELTESAQRLLPGSRPQERVLSWLALWPNWGGALRAAFAARDPFDFSLAVLRR